MSVSKGSVNKVTLIGRLGSDPELKYTPSGAAVANFTLATNQSYKDKDGNAVEKTDWHKIVVWRKPAELIAEYCKKGSRLYVEGRLETRSWDDNDGNKKYMTEVVLEQFTFLESSKQPNTTSDTDNNGYSDNSNDDDLPF